mgnify:CR=1 FL=1
MFTGIIQGLGRVESIAHGEQKATLWASLPFSDFELGESISLNGVCLTVVEWKENWAKFEIASETLRATSFSSLAVGDNLNIERAMRLADRLGGHIVLGHVDCISRITKIEKESDTWGLWLELPQGIAKFVAEKGSITLSGISLTVGSIKDNQFVVYVIPHTREVTILGESKVGQVLNVEVDCIARYVERLVSHA